MAALILFAPFGRSEPPHASREEALAFLRENHIYLQGMQVVSITWDDQKRVWFIALSFHGISTDTWMVDADAKKFWFVSHQQSALPTPDPANRSSQPVTGQKISSDDVADLRKKYLSDPAVSPDIKQAIQKGVVIPGMCPLQAFAAAGLPGFYEVQADKKWPGNIAPPKIINAQCDHPDDSVIKLTFHSATQFHTKQLVAFTAKFEHGRVVSIERLLPPTIARPP